MTLQKTLKRRLVAPFKMQWPTEIPPILQRIYAARGIDSPDSLNYRLERLHGSQTLKGLDAAASMLADAVQSDKRILFIGDFDADGATSTTVGLLALRGMGAKYVDYLVPDRFQFGYGLTREIVEVAKERRPDLLVTVDNGISSLEGVAAAKLLGWQVVVTDHHLPGDHLPDADAIVNPNQGECEFPSKALAGVGVIFYVMSAVRKELSERKWFSESVRPVFNLAELLDLVALGTVADVVPLDFNNRVLVEQGIRRIRAKRCRPGILALISVSGRRASSLNVTDLGFALAPRLNAAGRLEDMSLGIECLLAQDWNAALAYARDLDDLNHSRKAIEREMQAQAFQALEKISLNPNTMPEGICLYDESWHQGVVGILASRIKERTHRPVIAFALGEDGQLKGSARSINGLHMRDALDAIATQNPGLLNKFGGHAMAAGLTLHPDNYQIFGEAFRAEVSRRVAKEDFEAQILTDGELHPEEMMLSVADLIQRSGPWGQAFPAPLFDGYFELVNQRVVGGRHLKLTVRDPRSGDLFDAIAFNSEQSEVENGSRVRLVYSLDVNEYQGLKRLQLIVDYIESPN